MTMLFLEQVGAFIPDTSSSVKELIEPLRLTTGQTILYTRFLGLDRVVTATGLDLADMLTAAGESALRGVDRDHVRYLIHGHTMQHVAPPSRHMLDGVRRSLGLGNATAISISHQNCVIGLYGLQVARYLLHDADPRDKALIVTGDKILTQSIRIIPDTTIMGEAAAACLVGRSPRGDLIVGKAMRVLGQFYQCLGCPDDLKLEYKHIYQDVFTDVMRQALADAGIGAGDLAAVLPHNVNRLSWRQIASDLGLPASRVYLDNVSQLGHCFSSDPFINLATARAAGRVGPGDLVLMASAGLGASFAATVISLGAGAKS
jgi:3-oxoacyl-[acyl-carrier-protein] synthase III